MVKRFINFSSGGHFNPESKNIFAILKEGIMGTLFMKFMAMGSGGDGQRNSLLRTQS